MQRLRFSGLIVAARRAAGLRLDRTPPSTYDIFMRALSSFILVAFLAVFAVSNIAHGVSANTMALQMAMEHSDAISMGDCQACPTDGDDTADKTPCKLDCTAAGAVTLTTTASFENMLPIPRHDRPLSAAVPHGLRAPPDPFPPRTLI
jgi:hypothetical protein